MEQEYTDDIGSAMSVGEQIRAWRQARSLSVDDIARQMNISSVYVHAMEEGRYHAFAAKVYATGFLRHFTATFSLPDNHILLALLSQEWAAYAEMQPEKPRTVIRKKNWRLSWYLTPARAVGALGVLSLLFFLFFFGLQLVGFTRAPRLRIAEPLDGKVVNEPRVHVAGATDKESQLTINGREITMDELGNFDQEIELGAGVHTLHFLVQNRFGRIAQAERRVEVR